MSSSIGFTNGVMNAKVDSIGVHRLGIKLDSGVFSLLNANGLDLGINNPGYITLPSKVTPGTLVSYVLTANQSFVDDTGSSDIAGQLFGFTATGSGGDAIAVDVPFYLYIVANDAEDTLNVALSRIPNFTTAPATSELGKNGTVPTSSQLNMFMFGDPTLGDYDTNPCICIGSIRMQMASDDWTVQTLSLTDGIGQYQESILFTVPVGQFGANTTTYSVPNGGTACTFSSMEMSYMVHAKSGLCSLSGRMRNSAGGSTGATAVAATLSCPFYSREANGADAFDCAGAVVDLDATGATILTSTFISGDSQPNAIQFPKSTVGADDFVFWSQFANTFRQIKFASVFPIATE